VGNRSILLVEDEPQLLELLEKHLRRLGFEVEAHATGTSALSALENLDTNYDLVVADMGLPDMRGEELLSKLVGFRPHVPVLICSGSEFFISNLPEDLQRRIGFLQKPFLPKELAQKISEVIGF
jgi:DNA-binding response OmpR family regulator